MFLNEMIVVIQVCSILVIKFIERTNCTDTNAEQVAVLVSGVALEVSMQGLL